MKNTQHLLIEYLGSLRIGDGRRGLEPHQLLALRRLQGLLVALGKHRAPVAWAGAKCCGKDTWRLVAPADLPLGWTLRFSYLILPKGPFRLGKLRVLNA
jgi:hypothetical protein